MPRESLRGRGKPSSPGGLAGPKEGKTATAQDSAAPSPAVGACAWPGLRGKPQSDLQRSLHSPPGYGEQSVELQHRFAAIVQSYSRRSLSFALLPGKDGVRPKDQAFPGWSVGAECARASSGPCARAPGKPAVAEDGLRSRRASG